MEVLTNASDLTAARSLYLETLDDKVVENNESFTLVSNSSSVELRILIVDDDGKWYGSCLLLLHFHCM